MKDIILKILEEKGIEEPGDWIGGFREKERREIQFRNDLAEEIIAAIINHPSLHK